MSALLIGQEFFLELFLIENVAELFGTPTDVVKLINNVSNSKEMLENEAYEMNACQEQTNALVL